MAVPVSWMGRPHMTTVCSAIVQSQVTWDPPPPAKYIQTGAPGPHHTTRTPSCASSWTSLYRGPLPARYIQTCLLESDHMMTCFPPPPSQLQGQLVFQLKSLLILFILFYCIIILAGTTKLNTSILNLSAVIAHNSLSNAKPLIVDLILKLLGLNL